MYRIVLFCLLVMSLSSCRTFYPNLMFQTGSDFQYVNFDTIAPKEYKINPGDRIELQIYSNMGEQMVQVMVSGALGGGALARQTTNLTYLVRQDGYVELPILGDFYIQGYTIPEAQIEIREKLSEENLGKVQNPIVLLNVINRKVTVFNGGSETGKIIPLENENMNLIDVLALAGGIPPNGKAFRIKMIRGDVNNNPQVALIDLSTLEGMQQVNLRVEANDIIYVQPTTRLAPALMREISPYMAIVGTAVSLYLLYSRFADGN